jgi:protein tyrosine/serine phosphatase
MVLRAALLAAAVLAATGCAAADSSSGAATSADSEDVVEAKAPSNFLQVREGLYRGGHPDDSGIAYLKKLGVKRIVNLEVGDFIEAFPWDIDHELDAAAKAGLDEHRYPMSAFEAAASDRFDQQMNEIQQLLATATADDPVYVHCKHGQDRTGLVLGIERVEFEKWEPQKAHDEMVQIGFHTGFAGLEEYFEHRTGWHEDD